MPNPVQAVWLSGNSHERKLMFDKIKHQFSTYEVRLLEGEYNYGYLEREIYGGSIFSEKRLIIIKDLPIPNGTRATMITHLKKMFDNIPADVFIVVNGIAASEEKSLSSHVAKIGKLFEYPLKLDAGDASGWVISCFAKSDKTISDEDAQFLVEIGGYDSKLKGISADVLYLAIKKICMFVGNRKKAITRDDILVNAFPSEEFIIWQVADALDSKDISKCYSVFNKLVDDAAGNLENAIFTLFNIINSKYRLLVFLKEGIAKNMSKSQLAQEASAFEKLKQTGKDFKMTMVQAIYETGENKGQKQFTWSNYTIENALSGKFGKKAVIDMYNRKELFRILGVLQDAGAELKYRKTDSEIMLLVDALFFAVCGKMDDIHLATLRKSYD